MFGIVLKKYQKLGILCLEEVAHMKAKTLIATLAIMLSTILMGLSSVSAAHIYKTNITGAWTGNDYHNGDWTYGTTFVLSGTKGYSRYNTNSTHMSYVTIGGITASSQWVNSGVRTDANRVSNYGAVASECGIKNNY